MWLAFRTGIFTWLFSISFKHKNLKNNETTKRIKKTNDEIMKQVKESILTAEIANRDIESKAKNIKSSEEAVEVTNEIEKIITNVLYYG